MLMVDGKELVGDAYSHGREIEVHPLTKYPLNAVRLAAKVYAHVGLAGPYVIGLDLLRTAGCVLDHARSATGLNRELRKSDAEDILVPPIVVESLVPPDLAIGPLLERVWNAFWHDRAAGFNSAGRYEWDPDLLC